MTAEQTQHSPVPPASAAAQRVVLELAVTAAGVGTFDWDLQGDVLHWDDRLLDLFGFDHSDHERSIGQFYDRLHPGDRDRVVGLLRQAIDRLGSYEAEYRVALPGGAVRYVAARGRVLADPDGTPARLVGAAHDLTARRSTEALVARVTDSISLAFFALDHAWRFTYVNAEAARLLGRPAGELLGEDVWERFPAAVGSDFETHYRRAIATGEPAAFDAYYPEPLNAWYEVRAWPTPDGLAVYFLDVTERRRARDRVERALSHLGLLSQVTERLVAAATPDEAMGDLARLVVPALADWCVVSLTDDDGEPGSHRDLTASAGWHARPERRSLVEAYAAARLDQMTDRRFAAAAVDRGEPVRIDGAAWKAVADTLSPDAPARQLLAELAPEHIVVLPLLGSEQAVGMLSLCNDADRGPFTDDDLELARDVAARAGLVLDRARLHRRQRDVAEGLQRSLLAEPPTSPHFDLAVRYAPAAEAAQVGGDWYDVFVQPDGSLSLSIGDVMGHALAAAAAMGQLRTLVRGVAALHGDAGPSAVLSDVERVMRTLGIATTATAVVARLEALPPTAPAPWRLSWSNAGHPPPVVLDAAGRATVLAGPSADLLLGVDPATVRRQHTVDLHPGATVVLYTDGLVERRHQSVDAGIDRLVGLLGSLAGAPPAALCDELLRSLVPERPDDDVAVVVVRIRA